MLRLFWPLILFAIVAIVYTYILSQKYRSASSAEYTIEETNTVFQKTALTETSDDLTSLKTAMPRINDIVCEMYKCLKEEESAKKAYDKILLISKCAKFAYVPWILIWILIMILDFKVSGVNMFIIIDFAFISIAPCLLIVLVLIISKKNSSVVNNYIQEEQKKRESLILNNYDILQIIPDDYWYPMATSYMVKLLCSDRVTSKNDMLEKCDEQIHRWKVENKLKQQEEMIRQQTEMIKKIRTNHRSYYYYYKK